MTTINSDYTETKHLSLCCSSAIFIYVQFIFMFYFVYMLLQLCNNVIQVLLTVQFRIEGQKVPEFLHLHVDLLLVM